MKIKKLINKKFENIYDFYEEFEKRKLDFFTNYEILIQNELLNKNFNNTNINKFYTRNTINDNFVLIKYIVSGNTRTIVQVDELEPNVEFNNKLDKEKKRMYGEKYELIDSWIFNNGEEAFDIEKKILEKTKESTYDGEKIMYAGNKELRTKDIYNEIKDELCIF